MCHRMCLHRDGLGAPPKWKHALARMPQSARLHLGLPACSAEVSISGALEGLRLEVGRIGLHWVCALRWADMEKCSPQGSAGVA